MIDSKVDEQVKELIATINAKKSMPLAMREVVTALARSTIIAENSNDKTEIFFAMQAVQVLGALLTDQSNLLKRSDMNDLINNSPIFD